MVDFEKRTREDILDSIMSNWDNRYDKRQGSIIYDSTIAVANELAQAFLDLEDVERNQYPDTADRDRLLIWARERGVSEGEPTATVSRGVFNIDAQVQIGSRFNQSDLNFIAVSQLTDPETDELIPGNFALRCETLGTKANAYLGRLTPITTVPGMVSGHLTEVLIPGKDAEDTESIRQAVLDSYDSYSFGGSRQQYISWTEDLDGVGGAKAKRRVASTVDIIIINSAFQSPSPELIDAVQTALDPIENSGEGVGIAPIGHRVYVAGVTDHVINVAVKVEFVAPYIWNDVKDAVEKRIRDYFLGLAKAWADTDTTVVRVAELISSIVTLGGILDVTELTLNGASANIILDEKNIPVLGILTQIT